MADISDMKNFDFQLNYNKGLGIFPNSGPPVGGWGNTPGTDFYGQDLSTILPGKYIQFGFGNKSKSRKSKKKSKKSKSRKQKSKKSRKSKGRKKSRSFGYPLTDQELYGLNQVSGPGNIPGGVGGPILQGVPNFQQYWG